MIKYKRLFDRRVEHYGQTAILHRYTEGIKCPCYEEEEGYCDPQWHRNHPEAPLCNEEGYLKGEKDPVSLKAFIFPVYDLNQKQIKELLLTNIGKLEKDDYIYEGKTEIDIFNLKDTDFLEFDGKKLRIKNPDKYKIGDTSIAYVAKLEVLGSARTV